MQTRYRPLLWAVLAFVILLVSKAYGQENMEQQMMQKSGNQSSPAGMLHDAWWTNVVDNDGDGYRQRANLNYDLNVVGILTSLTVKEKIYYKLHTSSSWTFLTETADRSIISNMGNSTRTVTINSPGSHNEYDFKIDLYSRSLILFPFELKESRGPSDDADLNDEKMERANEDFATATIRDAWWSNEVDIDGDGYKRSARLNWDPNVVNSSGSLVVFERIFTKRHSSAQWTQLMQTSQHTISGTSGNDTWHVDIADMIPHDAYDVRIAIYRSGFPLTADYLRDPSNDGNLNDYRMEKASEDALTAGSLTVNVRDRINYWPPAWSGIVRLYGSGGNELKSASVNNSGTATFSGVSIGAGYFIRVWATPSPATVFGQEFWGRLDGITIQAGSQTVNFTANTPNIATIRAYDPVAGTDITGTTITKGSTIRVRVRIHNPHWETTQTLYTRLILDGDKQPLYAFDSGTSSSIQIPPGHYETFDFDYKPELVQPYYAIAAALITFSGQPTVCNGLDWTSAPLVTVAAPADNPVPVLSSISPSEKTAGEGNFTLTATGSKFISSSVVRFDGSNRTTTYVSATELRAAIAASDIANVGTHSITVFTESPGGGTSDTKTLTVLPVHKIAITAAPTGTPNPVASGGAVTCAVTAACSRGHSLSHAWSTTYGSFADPTSPSCTWTAPENSSGSPQTHIISVTINCGSISETRTYQQVVNPAGVAVLERLSGMPEEANLNQNYPNPFNPQTTIRFAVPERVNVRLVVYSALGQQVTELVNDLLDAGYYQVKFDGTGLASGVYFYRITAGEYFSVKRLLLLR